MLVAIGTRMELQYLRWRKFRPGLRIVRIDIDPREIARRPADRRAGDGRRLGTRALIEALAPAGAPAARGQEEFADVKAQARREFEVVRPQVRIWT